LANAEYINEYVIVPGHDKESHVISPLPHEYVANTSLLSVLFLCIAILTLYPLLYTRYISDDDIPESFSWNNIDGHGKSCITKTLNQHLPQYCKYKICMF